MPLDEIIVYLNDLGGYGDIAIGLDIAYHLKDMGIEPKVDISSSEDTRKKFFSITDNNEENLEINDNSEKKGSVLAIFPAASYETDNLIPNAEKVVLLHISEYGKMVSEQIFSELVIRTGLKVFPTKNPIVRQISSGLFLSQRVEKIITEIRDGSKDRTDYKKDILNRISGLDTKLPQLAEAEWGLFYSVNGGNGIFPKTLFEAEKQDETLANKPKAYFTFGLNKSKSYELENIVKCNAGYVRHNQLIEDVEINGEKTIIVDISSVDLTTFARILLVSELPIAVTGDKSFTLAYQKAQSELATAFFYETLPWKSQTGDELLGYLSPYQGLAKTYSSFMHSEHGSSSADGLAVDFITDQAMQASFIQAIRDIKPKMEVQYADQRPEIRDVLFNALDTIGFIADYFVGSGKI